MSEIRTLGKSPYCYCFSGKVIKKIKRGKEMQKLTIEDLKNPEYKTRGGDIFYAIGEVTEILKVTKPTIKNYIKKGKIKGEKLFGKWYVSENSLKKHLGLWYTEE